MLRHGLRSPRRELQRDRGLDFVSVQGLQPEADENGVVGADGDAPSSLFGSGQIDALPLDRLVVVVEPRAQIGFVPAEAFDFWDDGQADVLDLRRNLLQS